MSEPFVVLNLFPTLQVSLVDLCNAPRCLELQKLDSYAKSTQYNHRRFDWDGNMTGYGEQADISPGWYVPLKHRRPRARFDLPKLITTRLTAMSIGSERWPELKVPGDPDAEDYCKGLAEAAKLPVKILEAREKGGASGTAVVSFKFVDGNPRVMVHAARQMHPIRWVDRDELVLGAVLKAFPYRQTVWDKGKAKEVILYHARYWDEEKEVVWDPIPEALARNGTWASTVKSYTVKHGYGECPVYWAQNLADSESIDGLSDFEGLCDEFDEINELLSATAKGTKANVDPTTVIHDDPGNNPGIIRKGSGHAIYSKLGASYLELKGEAVKAGLEMVKELAQICLDLASVVRGDPAELASKAQSAAAMKIIYQPMIAQCDKLRGQYGELTKRVTLGMLRASRQIQGSTPGPVFQTLEGTRIQEKPVVFLPPKFELQPAEDGGDSKIVEVERTPGTSENLQLQWPEYFPATAADVKADVEAANLAKGSLVTSNTATRYVAHHFDVKDVDKEVAEVEAEADLEREKMAELEPDPAEGFE